MKAEHRHELKTNELAEWLRNIPLWAKANYTLLIYIAVVAVLVIGAAFYHWGIAQRRVQAQRINFTNQIMAFDRNLADVIQASAQGQDMSYTLLETVDELDRIAQAADSDDMAAWALVKRGQALRSELLYRPGTVQQEHLEDQLNRAIESYERALRRSDSKTVTAAAKLGIGLSYEELGQFDRAREYYEQIVGDDALSATIAFANAKTRLELMDNYTEQVVLAVDPAPAEPMEVDPPVGPRITPDMPEPPIQPPIEEHPDPELEQEVPLDPEAEPDIDMPLQ